MRDLRAELRNWDNEDPVEWKPVAGDILVGFVREHPPIDAANSTATAIVVEEERTGLPLLLKLNSPQLAVLFELHNPRPNDRIGIKCTGLDDDGSARFIMMVERDSRQEKPLARSEQCPENDFEGATAEERSFIEQMLTDAPPSDDPYECPADEGPHIMGVLTREEESLSRQTKSLDRLESMIKAACGEASTDQLDAKNLCTPVPDFVAVPYPEKAKRPKRRWLRALMALLVLVTACGLGIAYGFFRAMPSWWPHLH